MKTKYRTAFWVDSDRSKLANKLRDYGIHLNFGEFEVVEFDENTDRFNELLELFHQNRIRVDETTIYTDDERNNSDYLGVTPSWHHGYPQPEEHYLDISYDLTNYCAECGIGKEQIKPLRLIGEPKWGNKQIMQVNWIFDEYFVKPEIYDKIFKQHSIKFKEVLDHKKNILLQSAFQLDIKTINHDLKLDAYPYEVCKTCYKKKYSPVMRNGYPTLSRPTELSMFKSKEYFGSGARAFKLIFVNSLLYSNLTREKSKGIGFVPVFKV